MDIAELQQNADNLTSRAVTALTTDTPAPALPKSNLKPAEDELKKASTSRDVYDASLESSISDLKRVSETAKSAADAEARAKGDAAAADQTKAQAEADIHATVNQMFGLGTDPSSGQALVANKIAAIDPVLQDKATYIQQRDAVGPLDNILDWASWQLLERHSAVNDYNDLEEKRNQLQHTLDKSVASAAAVSDGLVKGLPNVTVAQAKAKTDLALAEAAKQKAMVDEQFARTQVDWASKKLAADLSISQQTENMTRMKQEETFRQYQAQIESVRIAQTNGERLLRASELMKNIANEKGLQILLDQYDNKLGNVKGTTNLFVFKNLPEQQKANMIAYASGNAGTSPLDAAININQFKLGKGYPAEAQAFYSDIMTQAQAYAKSPDIMLITDPKLKHEAISNLIKKDLLANVEKASDRNSLFHELAPGVLMANEGSISPDSPTFKALKPLVDTGSVPDTKTIMSTIAAAYPNDFNAQNNAISQYYAANIRLRNQVLPTGDFNLKLPLEYKISARNPLGFGSLGQFDITKPAEVAKYRLLMDTQRRFASAEMNTLGDRTGAQ